MSTRSTTKFPLRFRRAEQRGRRITRLLKFMGRVRGVDGALIERLGRALLERDELGHSLAKAIQAREVSMAQFQRALQQGLAAVPEAAPALRTFFDEVTTVPSWVDFERINRGARVMARFGRNGSDVLTQLSLIGGYRFGGPTDVLVATGGLSGASARRRLAETQKWGASLGTQDGLRPGAEGWRLTVHVRVMHALINASLEPRWDIERWGLPINQADQAGTLGLFDGTLIIGCRALGVRVTAEDASAVMHLWKWVGHLMGVQADFLTDDEWERHRINYHVILTQDEVSEAGPKLARAIVDAQRARRFQGWPQVLQPVRGWYEQERLLSMLTVFLGFESMRELQLPIRPPWALLGRIPFNFVQYQLLSRTEWGLRALETLGGRFTERMIESYFAGEPNEIGALREA
jgi:hypothetical protein